LEKVLQVNHDVTKKNDGVEDEEAQEIDKAKQRLSTLYRQS